MFLNEVNFQLKIEEIVRAKRLNYMDAVLQFCLENEMEPDDIKKFVSSNLKDKIRMAAQEDGFMKKTSRLPI